MRHARAQPRIQIESRGVALDRVPDTAPHVALRDPLHLLQCSPVRLLFTPPPKEEGVTCALAALGYLPIAPNPHPRGQGDPFKRGQGPVLLRDPGRVLAVEECQECAEAITAPSLLPGADLRPRWDVGEMVGRRGKDSLNRYLTPV